MKISLAKLQSIASERPPGYLEDCLAAGELRDDGYLYLSRQAAHTLRLKYSSSSSPSVPSSPKPAPIRTPKLRGLGDTVALVAKPIARAIDRVAGTKLEGCKPCARRQAKLNALVPFGNSPKHS